MSRVQWLQDLLADPLKSRQLLDALKAMGERENALLNAGMDAGGVPTTVNGALRIQTVEGMPAGLAAEINQSLWDIHNRQETTR
jgi:hypothetical protein